MRKKRLQFLEHAIGLVGWDVGVQLFRFLVLVVLSLPSLVETVELKGSLIIHCSECAVACTSVMFHSWLSLVLPLLVCVCVSLSMRSGSCV